MLTMKRKLEGNTYNVPQLPISKHFECEVSHKVNLHIISEIMLYYQLGQKYQVSVYPPLSTCTWLL